MTKFIPFFILAFAFITTAQASLTCQDAWECCANKDSGSCCPGLDTETIYSCPTGWILSLTGNTCTRIKDLETSDNKGYYSQTYGTCAATPSKKTCHYYTNNTSSSSPSPGGGLSKCFICGYLNPGDKI